MKISIITVCLNSADTIEDTIQSVITQDYSNIEYIVIDGGSKDGTLDIIKKYSDSISFWCSESDDGIYDAMNKGIKASSGDIIGIINSDDWYENGIFGIIACAFTDYDIDVLFGDFYALDEQNIRKNVLYPSFGALWYQMVFGHPAVFVRRRVYEKNGIFDTNYRIAADYELMNRLWNCHVKFAYMKKIFSNYRTTGLSNRMRELRFRETMEISQKYLNVNLFIEAFYESGINRERPLFIWGAGENGKRIVSFLNQCGIKIDGIFDNDVSKQGFIYEGIQVFDVNRANGICGQIVIATARYYGEILKQIKKIGKDYFTVYYYKDIFEKYERKLLRINGNRMVIGNEI